LQILSYYKPTSKLQPLFASATKQLLTPPEVREMVTSYVEAENLVSETNKRLVKLDPILSNAVFDGSGKLDKEVLTKGTVPRDALIDRVLHAMSTSYAILRNSSDPSNARAKSGAPPKVHITLETRSGNKTVTKVSGLEPYFINPRLLADELRKVCAGSTSVEPLAGAAKKNEKPVEEVMVQGPQKDAVVKALERRGVDKRWVEVLDKTKGKKR
jgi:translation initiation factor 2D